MNISQTDLQNMYNTVNQNVYKTIVNNKTSSSLYTIQEIKNDISVGGWFSSNKYYQYK
jgi:hypothetical protein